MNLLRRPPPLNNALGQQAALDNAPVGSVGAPGGLLGFVPQQKPTNYLRGLLAGASVVPGIGDAMGMANDAYMYATDPQSRTWLNYLLTGLGTLPMVLKGAEE